MAIFAQVVIALVLEQVVDVPETLQFGHDLDGQGVGQFAQLAKLRRGIGTGHTDPGSAGVVVFILDFQQHDVDTGVGENAERFEQPLEAGLVPLEIDVNTSIADGRPVADFGSRKRAGAHAAELDQSLQAVPEPGGIPSLYLDSICSGAQDESLFLLRQALAQLRVDGREVRGTAEDRREITSRLRGER